MGTTFGRNRISVRVLIAIVVSLGIASTIPASAPSTPPTTAPGAPAPPGASRDGPVAVPMDSGPVELTYLARSMSEEDRAALRRAIPNVRMLVGLSPEEALRVAPEVDGIDGRYCSRGFLRAASKLRWVQATSAGVERYLALPELRDDDRIVLTNMQAVHGPTIADHAFAMLLALTRDLPYYVDPAHRGAWNRNGSGTTRIALQDRTLLVVGLGGIGSEVAKRGKGFGMRVWATRRSDTPPPPYVDRQERSGALRELLPEADVVVLCVPLTPETKGMIGAEELAALKPGAYLVNVARGKVVDTAALVQALEDGRLAGACLDVTDPEPLPPDHRLWTMDNVVITPHVSGRSALTEDRRRALYLDNLRRFGKGEPLVNVVDKQAGY